MKSSKNLILGITDIHGYTHDNSIAILQNNKILFACSEERYTRIKHDPSFPIHSIKNGLRYLKRKPSDISLIAVGYPIRKSFSILQNKYCYEIIPFTFNLLANRNIRIVEDIYKILLTSQKKKVKGKKQYFLKNKRIEYYDHHMSHSASAYFTSGFKKSISIVIDAFGSDKQGRIRSGAVYLYDENEVKEVMSIPTHSSLAIFYQCVTYVLGFKPGDGEGKTMGLAAYGKPQNSYSALYPYAPHFKNGQWVRAKDWISGIITTMPDISYLFMSSNFGKNLQNSLDKYKREDIAASAQKILEEELIKLVSYLAKKYPEHCKNVCLSGGLFLNVKGNKKIAEIRGVENVFVQPAAGDAGVALGAAFLASMSKKDSKNVSKPLLNAGLGEHFNNNQIAKELKKYKDQITYKKRNNIALYTANEIVKGKVIGWFQGRSEWGPRALGFRSVVADPRTIDVKERINHVLKNREWFMPFAPSIIEEEGEKYFNNFKASPFMTLTFDSQKEKHKLFPAAIHIDKTARPNSVNPSNNPLYYQLIKYFYKKTGLPIVLNTSFNRHGLPVVNSPKDAVDHLIMGAVDELIIGNYSAERKQ